MKRVLVTGGAGYIGSHTCVELIGQGYDVTVVDNLSNSSALSLDRIHTITGKRPNLVVADLLDKNALSALFGDNEFESVVHFAGLKAVGESNQKPLEYYQNNVITTVNLLDAMRQNGCLNLVFSSSATVYGDPHSVPITEDFPLSATNPYGRTKLMIEEILRDLAKSDQQWNISILRYFNPVAAHPSGLIGEDPNGIPNNLMPYVAQVGVGKLKQVAVYGNDYETPDGTGVRDYIHVVDLARAHLKALESLREHSGCHAYNVGTGQGYSVLEMIAAFAKASGVDIPYQVQGRREGDIASCYANTDLARSTLKWQAEYGLDQMMQDQWKWQSTNPNGYKDE
jgi:UDP-glucose 4-epimerase